MMNWLARWTEMGAHMGARQRQLDGLETALNQWAQARA